MLFEDFDFGDFFDLPENSYPADGRYYFNILLYNVHVRTGGLSSPSSTGVSDIWFLDKVTDPRPIAVHLFEDSDIDNLTNGDYIIDQVPHTVIEVRDSGEVSWYTMFVGKTDTPWNFRIPLDDLLGIDSDEDDEDWDEDWDFEEDEWDDDDDDDFGDIRFKE